MELAISFEAVETVRASLCATSRKSSHIAVPVHINKIAFLAHGLGFTGEIRPVLDILEKLGELQSLQDGFWFPVPTRIIPIENNRLILSALPNMELQRLLGATVISAGYGRIVNGELAKEIQVQPIDQWLGPIPQDLAAWTEILLEKAMQEMQPSVSQNESIEIYVCWRAIDIPEPWQSLRWKRLVKLRDLPIEGPFLCRVKNRFGPYTYLFARIRNSRVYQEAYCDSDLNRLKYGLDIIHKAVNRCEWVRNGNEVEISLPNPLPNSEAKFLLATATDVSGNNLPKKYRFHERFEEAVRSLLIQLGYTIEVEG